MNNDVVALASVLLFLLLNVSLFSSSLLSSVLVTHGTSFVLFHLCVISRKFSSCPNIIISYYRQIFIVYMICWSRRRRHWHHQYR